MILILVVESPVDTERHTNRRHNRIAVVAECKIGEVVGRAAVHGPWWGRPGATVAAGVPRAAAGGEGAIGTSGSVGAERKPVVCRALGPPIGPRNRIPLAVTHTGLGELTTTRQLDQVSAGSIEQTRAATRFHEVGRGAATPSPTSALRQNQPREGSDVGVVSRCSRRRSHRAAGCCRSSACRRAACCSAPVTSRRPRNHRPPSPAQQVRQADQGGDIARISQERRDAEHIQLDAADRRLVEKLGGAAKTQHGQRQRVERIGTHAASTASPTTTFDNPERLTR